jgi:hypothetical protein
MSILRPSLHSVCDSRIRYAPFVPATPSVTALSAGHEKPFAQKNLMTHFSDKYDLFIFYLFILFFLLPFFLSLIFYPYIPFLSGQPSDHWTCTSGAVSVSRQAPCKTTNSCALATSVKPAVTACTVYMSACR